MENRRVDVARFAWRGERFVIVGFSTPSLDELTPAERVVAEMLCDGLSNEQIAARRGSKPRTVANQVASILRKLKVPSRHHVPLAFGR